MRLIVFGSTGGTGRQLVSQALQQGHAVTAFARRPESIDERHANLKRVRGDVWDAVAVERAVEGQEVVLCALGAPPRDKRMVRTEGTRRILGAMERTGVRRLICQSTAGAGDSRDTLPPLMKYLVVPLLLRRAWADHELQEGHIKASALEWIIARPAALTDGGRTGVYQHGYTADNPTVTHKISRADTADFMLKQVVDDTYLHRTPCLSY